MSLKAKPTSWLGKLKKLKVDNTLGEPFVSLVEFQQCPKQGQKKNNVYVDFKAPNAFNTDSYIRVINNQQNSFVLRFGNH